MLAAQRQVVLSVVEPLARLGWGYKRVTTEVIKQTGLKVSADTIKYMLKKFKECGSLDRRPGSGRKSKFAKRCAI